MTNDESLTQNMTASQDFLLLLCTPRLVGLDQVDADAQPPDGIPRGSRQAFPHANHNERGQL